MYIFMCFTKVYEYQGRVGSHCMCARVFCSFYILIDIAQYKCAVNCQNARVSSLSFNFKAFSSNNSDGHNLNHSKSKFGQTFLVIILNLSNSQIYQHLNQ